MTDYVIMPGTDYVAACDAIREQTGTTGKIVSGSMAALIRSVQGTGTAGIPDDVVTEANRIASSILSKKGSNSITFIAMSDMHEMGDSDWSDQTIIERYRRANLNAGQGARVIAEKINPDFFANLGDLAWGAKTTTTHDLAQSIVRARGYTAGLEPLTECFFTPGNHDVGYDAGNFDENLVVGMIGNYSYKDFITKKVRVICLNTADNTDGTDSCERVSGEQLQWFADALDMTEKYGNEVFPVSAFELDDSGFSEPRSGTILTPGNTYIVTFNGVTYEGVAMGADDEYAPGAPYLGNKYIAAGIEDMGDSEYPFTIIDWGDGTWEVDCRTAAYSSVTCGLREKTNDISEWGIVVLSHHPLDYGNVKVLANCLAAYLNGTNYSTTHDGMTISKNFTGKNAPEFIANFHGHLHSLFVTDIAGTTVKRIAIPNACFGRNNEYGTEETTYNKSDNNTGKNTAFNVVSIDLAQKIIYADCFGAGYDRIISYGTADVTTHTVNNSLANASTTNGSATVLGGSSYSAVITADDGYELDTITVTMGGTDITATAVNGSNITIANVTGDIVITATTVQTVVPPSYTNLVPLSIDTDGSIYNGTGYQEGYRLNSSGATTELAKAVNSGFIPYNGEVIRVCGTTSANSANSGNYVALYDASFANLYVVSMSNAVTWGGTWEEKDSKYMLTFDPATCSNTTVKNHLLSAKYIRASMAECAGANFIVTLNEPIE